VLANDTDADGDPLTAILIDGPAHGTLTLNADGSLSYTPAEGFMGEDTFTYKANDGEDDSNVATVTIIVRDEAIENVAPLSADDTFATSIDTPLVISPSGVLANDTDLNGDTLTAAIVSSPTHGTLTMSTDGSFTYTPNAGFVGTDTFTYVASDGLLTGNNALVTITVSNVDNTRPNALNDQYQTSSGNPLIVPGVGLLNTNPHVGVLANDSDAQGDGLTALLFSGPQHGTVQLNSNGSFTYTPNEGFVGQDSFIYRAFDGVRYSALAAVTIRVMAPPAATSFALVDSLMDVVAGGHDDEEDAWLASAVDALFGSDDLLA
jgi:VCBS repeat-containing protein